MGRLRNPPTHFPTHAAHAYACTHEPLTRACDGQPLDPLTAQKRRGLLSSIRCVAKFAHGAGGRDPFAPPPEEHEDPDTPSSYEHLVICTTRDAPTAFMYSIEPAGLGQPGGDGDISPAASSRVGSQGGAACVGVWMGGVWMVVVGAVGESVGM